MKFIPLTEFEFVPDSAHASGLELTADRNALKDEFKSAFKAGEGRLGNAHFFYRYFINVKYILYSYIHKAYLRIESGESGEFLLRESYLILIFRNGMEGKLRFEREENVRLILDYLKENYPHIETGYKKPR